MTGLGIDIAAVAGTLRALPDGELDTAIAVFEAGSRDLERPLGRGFVALAGMRALELMRAGVDPEDTLRTFDYELRRGLSARSLGLIEQRLAALAGKDFEDD